MTLITANGGTAASTGVDRATFMQGIVLGAFVQGIEVDGRAYGGGWWDWHALHRDVWFRFACKLLTTGRCLVGYEDLG